MCNDELLQRSDGWTGTRAAAVRSRDGKKLVWLSPATLDSKELLVNEDHTSFIGETRVLTLRIVFIRYKAEEAF